MVERISLVIMALFAILVVVIIIVNGVQNDESN